MTSTVHEHHTAPAADSSAGWAALVIVLLAVLVAGGLYFSGYFATAEDSNDINIDLPETTQPQVPEADDSEPLTPDSTETPTE